MISFFANLFGYILNFLYELVNNFGVAIILFSILVKLIMLPISIKQQKTLKKSQKINEEMKQIQFKYKNDPEKMNQEVMALYKREKLSPFSGCFSAIAQIVLLFAMFYLVRSPLTYMKKVDAEVINNLVATVQEHGYTSNYQEIAVINYINSLETQESVEEKEENTTANQEIVEENEAEQDQGEENTSTDEIDINAYKDEIYINMDFLGIDLSKVPTDDLTDFKVLIIPVLYVISSFISIKLSTPNKKSKKLLGDGTQEEKIEEYDPMAQANKSMTLFAPLMSICIACIAPLGLALYWLVNNLLMILEKLILNKFLKNE